MTMTIYELAWGHNGIDTQRRYFTPFEQCDAYVRLAERIIELDSHPAIWAAHVSLKRTDREFAEVAWTKTSNERPTSEGSLTIPTEA